MKSIRILLAALALLCLAGCAEHVTYDTAKKIEAKWPGCEIVDQNSWSAQRAYVRRADGAVFEVWYSPSRNDVMVGRVIFPANK
jgi:outer membrane biogenesis lipoprotein LolB